jgi:hypothetical protein
MKTASKKTSAAKASGKPATTSQASSAAVVGKVEDGLVDKQPEVKEKAAVARAMFLFTNDAWAQRYYDPNDLHFLEREVFG